VKKSDKHGSKSTEPSVNDGVSGGKKSVPRDVKITLLMSALSTTMRLIVPVMGLFLIGLGVDAMLGRPAMWAIIGAVVGFVIAAWLIYQQIKKLGVNDDKEAK
jgi:hypothetical protein